MLGKLLKYDFKSLGKKLIPLFLGLLALALFTKCFFLIAGNNAIMSIPKGFITAAFIIGLVAIPMITFIQGIVHFYQNLIKDEGYLTHTLPVKKSSIVLSKCIVANMYLLISLLVSFLVWAVVYYSPANWQLIMDFFNEIMKVFTPSVLILTLITSGVGFIMQYFMFTLAIALGQQQNTRKGMYSVVYGIALYTVTQIISSVSLFGYMLIDPNIMDELEQEIPSMSAMAGLMGITLVISVIICIVFYYATVYIFNKRLNLE